MAVRFRRLAVAEFGQYPDDGGSDLEGAQLLPQVHLVIGATSEQEALAPFTQAQRKRVRWVRVTDQAGHSTVTGACEPDRRGFRNQVLEIIRPGH